MTENPYHSPSDPGVRSDRAPSQGTTAAGQRGALLVFSAASSRGGDGRASHWADQPQSCASLQLSMFYWVRTDIYSCRLDNCVSCRLSVEDSAMQRIAVCLLLLCSLLVTTGCSYDTLYSLLEYSYTEGGVGESRRQHYNSHIRQWEMRDGSVGH